MTEQTNAELIAEAQTHVTDEYITPDTSPEESLIRRLATALQAAEEQAAEYAAVVEKVRNADAASSSWDDFGHLVLEILDTAPADVLREVKADVWDEGSETGFTHGMSYQAGNNSAMNYRNPYRIERGAGLK